MISFSITGIKNVIRKFQAFGSQYNWEIRAAMWEIVLVIERDAKVECPVDKGALRNSIKGVVSAMTKAAITGQVKASTHYAVYVHEGTVNMAARPFIMNAVRKNKKFIEDRLGSKAFRNVQRKVL